jgi:acetyl-CoA carboxylase carboxyl transferase subunit beta
VAWFKRAQAPLQPRPATESRVPEGLWVKCGSCKEILYRKDVLKNLSVCPRCAFHFRVSARERLAMLFDAAFEEFDTRLVSADPLDFRDSKPYAERLKAGKAKTDSYDAVVSATGAMGGRRTVIAAMEYGFIGGSMGVVVGEKVTRAIERALEEKLPLVVVSCSGGARMMEGTLSLMQMAKISAALARLQQAPLPFLSVLTDPTTGGVTASYAMLGDLNIAEPGALIGFAGPRVIEQTIRQKLPEGFQRSEFLLEHGMIDMVVDRRELKKTLVRCLSLLLD